MVETGEARVRRLGGDRAGEMRITRFLRNRAVTVHEMIATAFKRTASRVQGRHILAIQDTTDARTNDDNTGIALHPMIAVDAADGALLGLVHAEFLRRPGGRPDHRTLPYKAKESARWLRGYYGKPGPIVIYNGLIRYQSIRVGFALRDV